MARPSLRAALLGVLLPVLLIAPTGLATAASAAHAPAGTQRPGEPGTVLSKEPLARDQWLPGTADAHLLRYVSTGWNEQRTVVSGTVFVPEGDRPSGGWPVVSWSHGTTGVADNCAPSRTGMSERDTNYLKEWLAAGYAVVATDYEGLGTPGPHPYLDGKSAAYGVTDMVRAAHRADPSLSTSWIVVGQSQGGHSALWTGAVAKEYAPELDFRGSIATAPPTHLVDSVEASPRPQPEWPAITGMFPLAAGVHTTHPDVDMTDYLTPKGMEILKGTQDKLCFDDLIAKLQEEKLTNGDVMQDMDVFTRLTEFLASEEVPVKPYSRPVFIAQGTADQLVVPKMTELTANQLKDAGSDVTFKLYEGADHSGVMQAALPDLLQWAAVQFGSGKANS